MMQLKTLSSKAMLVKLTTRRANLTKRDMMAEEYLQAELGDTAFIVNKKLFRDPLNPINQIMSKASEVYTYHKKHTLAYIDKGPRLLPNNQYFEYTSNMRNIIQEVDSMMALHMPNYDKYVQLDVQSRIAQDSGKAKPIRYVAPSIDDYPTAEVFERGMGHDIRFSPLPESKHFLFDISDADMEAFNRTMEEVQENARAEVIKKMMQPLGHLIDKLNKPIGTEGAIFRDSAIENIIEGIEMARKLNVNDDPEITEMAQTIGQAISVFANNGAVLRESPIVRENTAKKLDEIAKQMGFMYGNN
jgi:hypothetical protein